MKKCPVCDKEFETTIERKKYCCYSCGALKNKLTKCKELMRLNPEEKELRKKLMRKPA